MDIETLQGIEGARRRQLELEIARLSLGAESYEQSIEEKSHEIAEKFQENYLMVQNIHAVLFHETDSETRKITLGSGSNEGEGARELYAIVHKTGSMKVEFYTRDELGEYSLDVTEHLAQCRFKAKRGLPAIDLSGEEVVWEKRKPNQADSREATIEFARQELLKTEATTWMLWDAIHAPGLNDDLAERAQITGSLGLLRYNTVND